MTANRLVPSLWSFFVRAGVFVVLEGACALLAERNSLAGSGRGVDLLFGLLAMVAVPMWPAVAALGARAVLAAGDTTWRFVPAYSRSARACLGVLPYLGAPLVALMWAAPASAWWLAGMGVAYIAVAASLGCLLARGTAPWGLHAAGRAIARFGALFALVAVVAIRAWQPELSLAPLFTTGAHLVFPFERHRPHAPVKAPATAAHPVPPLAPGRDAFALLAAMAVVMLGATAALWRVQPALRGEEEPEPLADLWPTVIPFAGALGLLVLDNALLPSLAPRPRAYTLLGDEALVLAALALAIPEISRVCREGFHTAAGAVTCLAAAAVLGLEEVWVHDLPTSLSVLLSVLAFSALAASATRSLEQSFEEPVAWSIWLCGTSVIGLVLVLTDALYLKLELHDVPWIWQVFVACWVVTKITVIVLILFVAVLLPEWLKPASSPAQPASAPTHAS